MEIDYDVLTQPVDGLTEAAAKITADQRKEWAEKGVALSDGSFPVPDLKFLDKAISSWGRAVAAGKAAQVKRHMLKRAKELNASDEKVEQIRNLAEALGLSEAERSLDEQAMRVRRAWTKLQESRVAPGQPYSYPDEVFADHVVVSLGEDTFSIPYSESGGDVTFDMDKASKVQRAWVAAEAVVTDDGEVHLTEASTGDEFILAPLVEAKGEKPDGSKWEVVLIKAGTSKNRVRYTEKVLKEAAPLFEGAKVLARSDQDHLAGRDKSVRNIVGWISGVSYKQKALRGTLHVSEAAQWLRTLLLDAWSEGKRDLVGLSIVAGGTGRLVQEGFQQFTEVDSIVQVTSVDVVFEPAAGGGLVKLVAAVGKEESMGLEDLTTEELQAELSKRSASAPPSGEPNGTPPEGEGTPPASTGTQDPAPATEPTPAPITQPEPAMAGAGTAPAPAAGIVATAEAVTDPNVVPGGVVARLVIRETLDGTKLPEISRARITKRFAAGGFTEVQLTEAVQDEIDLFAALEKDGLVRSGGLSRDDVQVTLEEATKVKAALDGFFAEEDVEIEGTKVPRFRSFKEAYVKVTGDVGITGRLPLHGDGAFGLSEANGGRTRVSRWVYDAQVQTFVEAVLSSTFAEILGDSITRKALREYAQLDLNIWEPLADVVPASDFRTQRRMRMGGYPNLATVAQNAAYLAMTTPGDEEATYAVTKRGGLETVTIEAIANDDVGFLRRIPTRIARAAGQTLHEFVLEFLAANATIYDAVALFAAGHNNIGTTALSAASLKAARLRMRKQTDMSNSKRIGLSARYLWVPEDLEDVAFEILEADGKPGSADNDANFLRGKLQTRVVGYWLDTNNWFLSADKAQTPLIEVAFFGSEEPEIFTQDMGNVGSMFDNDRLTYKVRHVYGGAVSDFRGLDGSIVA